MRASGEQLSFQAGLFCHSAPTLTLRTLVASIPIVRAYFRETQEMLFDAHEHAFAPKATGKRRGLPRSTGASSRLVVGRSAAEAIGTRASEATIRGRLIGSNPCCTMTATAA